MPRNTLLGVIGAALLLAPALPGREFKDIATLDGSARGTVAASWTVRGGRNGSLAIAPPTSASGPTFVGVLTDELAPEDHGRPLTTLLDREAPSLARFLAGEGFDVDTVGVRSRQVPLAGGPGAVATWSATARGEPGAAWGGLVVGRGRYAVVVAAGAERSAEELFAEARRLLGSLRLSTPVRDAEAERALRGRTAEPAGAAPGRADLRYQFLPSNGVRRTFGPSVDFGAYEVTGGQLRLDFGSEREVAELRAEAGTVTGFRLETRDVSLELH